MSENQNSADMFMLELFHTEVENHARTLEEGLVRVEDDQSASAIEPLMRAAHSIKGAARIVGLDDAVTLAHAMEDVLTAAQSGKLRLGQAIIDELLGGNDIFIDTIDQPVGEIESFFKSNKEKIEQISNNLKKLMSGEKPASQTESLPKPAPEPKPAPPKKEEPPQKNEPKQESGGADMFMLELFHTEVENHARTLEE
ncbi:MAG: Hpt domain-containing protein, partial [Candidatus Kapaibacterium sp.]